VAHRTATPFDQPIAVITLKIKDSVIGARFRVPAPTASILHIACGSSVARPS
jgi:hypothetical protein